MAAAGGKTVAQLPHPKYKRRTFDEAEALARQAFRASAKDYLTEADLSEMAQSCATGGGSPGTDWQPDTGFEPDIRLFYEFQVYRPSNECPYITKYYARILVSRDRASEAVWIKWRPPVPKYDGPEFS
jgi:uncharacterized protein YciU (UPF0263 family)